MRKAWLWGTLCIVWLPVGAAAFAENPGCLTQTPKQCLELALTAMGGREELLKLKGVRLHSVGHTLLMEQSYRQEPFITSYEHDVTTLDFAAQRMIAEQTLTWPENDNNQPDSTTTLIVGPEGGVYRDKTGDSPCGLGPLNTAREMLALGPARVLLTAANAADLRFAPPEAMRGTAHTVLAFTWKDHPVRVLLNPFNHLPDAVETTQQFDDFWFFWGDVQQRIYFDNWKQVQGIAYPTNLVEERNGSVWSSTQALNVEFNVPVDSKAFAMDAETAKKSSTSPGWKRAFSGKKDTALAPGIDLFPGAWNSTIVKEPGGIVILEAPISGNYTKGVIDEAKRHYPGQPILTVLSTSDSWPHTGGVREAVAEGIPVTILDLNRPLLERMVNAPHTLDPDALEKAHGQPKPKWRIVSDKELVGAGDNRMELYPLRGASTERQYMVYFPDARLLYASDTLALNEDGSLYDPELMHEVEQAVRREHLAVDTVFAMHQEPVPWQQVMALLAKAEH